MELPKNVVQIGKPDKVHKIFIEDYVVSYIKQLNRECDGRSVGVALYGRFCEETGCKYYFLYGAAQVNGLEHRGAYLSQRDKEEIAETGQKFFEEYEFLAWCCVKDDPLEKLFVKTQGKGVEVEGYACFYEKNESMLNYMMLCEQKPGDKYAEAKKEESVSGSGNVKNRIDAERKIRGDWYAGEYMKLNEKSEDAEESSYEEKMPIVSQKPVLMKNFELRKTGYMKLAAVTMFLALCVVGITTLNDYGKLKDLQVVANQVIANMTEQKLPDVQKQEEISGGDLRGNTISGGTVEQVPVLSVPEPVALPETTLPEKDISGNETLKSQQEPVISPVVANVPETYTISKGDTLNSICINKYGSLGRLYEICELNGISNADNIQIGQTILLP